MGLLESRVIAAILTGVVASIVTAVISIFTFKKQNISQYITSERGLWRKEIRDIAHRLEKANERNIGSVLVDLKVRLNAYGFSASINSYDQDEHIWKIINKIEKSKSDSELAFEEKKQLLIMYISILLKHDWERAKSEETGDWLNFISCSTLIMALFSYSWGVYLWLDNVGASMSFKIEYVIVVVVVGVFIWIICYVLPRKGIIEDFMNKALKYRIEKKYKRAVMMEVSAIVGYFSFAAFGLYSVYDFYKDLKMDSTIVVYIAILVSLLLLLIFTVCNGYEIYKKYDSKNRYYEAVNRCSKLFSKDL